MTFDIELKIKGINAYSLGGLKKIETSEDGYLLTTIFDTRRYSLSDVEYIKILEVCYEEE